MKYSIEAKVPTHHTSGDLRRNFNLTMKVQGNGVHVGYEEFETKEEATNYLIERLNSYNESYPLSIEEYDKHLYYITQQDYLTLDNITAFINEVI